ncbi:MAG: UDP-N-acetylmuramoylalanyl-D-glutamate--2,6-diaminopimelate ligase [Bacteroides sp. SM23_62_1]|nr:MAG: UDP-N-acetylmuramoylalanyl-D-glutamate--2,6-diaminopimelate ligase [Bacteroides sp. SM23_62_1]
MKQLEDILDKIRVLEITGRKDVVISGICFDSRIVSPGDLFIAVRGTKTDGHNFIDSAVDMGCVAVVCEKLPARIKQGTTYLRVEDSAKALGMAASNFYDAPSERLILIGITGTNGKTTIATLLYRLFREMGHGAGLISTIRNMIQDDPVASTHTTPDAVSINNLLSQMVQAGCEYCFMEVSSHAISQHRIEGLSFSGGIFTNLTHDHLDYHTDFNDYLLTKKKFFDRLSDTAIALINADDRNGKVMVQNTAATIHTYALRSVSDYKCKVLESHLDGTLLKIGDHELWTNLIGEFNAYNIVAVYGCAMLLVQEEEKVLTALSSMSPVNGRAETIISGRGVTAIVDYAHTPDALENILVTIRKIVNEKHKIITVIGAGGDRDRKKRPLMGRIAAFNSNRVILTSDNPRSEMPEEIINDMRAGIDSQLTGKVISITNRREAIRTAFMLAEKGDVILVAGKGHETYQEIKGKRIHFDDKEIIRDIIQQ